MLPEPGAPLLESPVVHTQARPTSVRWRICALMTIVSFVGYFLRSNMSIAGAPMAADLGLSNVQLGLVLAAFAWGYAVFQFPGGVIGDLVGARRSLTTLAALWGVLNALVALVPGPPFLSSTLTILGLMGLRFLMGAAQAPLFPIIGGTTACNWFPVSGWALPLSLQNVGLTFGAAATGPLIAWLTEHAGWRESFLLTAPAGLLMAAGWWWYVRDRPSQHPGVNAAEQALIDHGRGGRMAEPVEPGAWRAVLRNRQVQLLTAGYFCSNYVFYFFFNWLFVYLIESRGFKLLEGGWYAALPWITGAAGALVGGWLCDRLWKRIGVRRACSLLGAAGLAASGVLLLAAAGAPRPLAAVLFLSLCLGAQQFTDAIYWAATIAVAGRHASAAAGIMNTGGNVVGGFAALLVPIMVAWLGWPAALASGSAFAFAGAALWLVTATDRAMEQADEAQAAGAVA